MLFYRGVSNVKYNLRPGVYFDDSTTEYDEYHNILLEYTEEFNSKDHLGTLAKMQHYGASTRLLDISDNILTSLFFAVEQGNKCDGKVWIFKVVKRDVLYHNSDKAMMLACLPAIREEDKAKIKLFCEKHPDEITDRHVVGHPEMVKFLHEIRGEYPAFETAIVGKDILRSYFAQVNKGDVRMKIQNGYFAIFGLDIKDGQRYLERKTVAEITIKANRKQQILDSLELMGIHSDTVYPELERTALYLRSKKLGWQDLNE